jgi:hypothetical protein
MPRAKKSTTRNDEGRWMVQRPSVRLVMAAREKMAVTAERGTFSAASAGLSLHA